MKIEKIDHICFAVKDLKQAVKMYEEKLDLVPDLTYVDENEKIRVARYYIGDVAIELMESTSPDGEVAKFIRRKGEGFYLISFKVEDVVKELKELQAKNMKLIDDKPRHLNGLRFAFLEPPQRMLGTLIEIIDGELKPEENA